MRSGRPLRWWRRHEDVQTIDLSAPEHQWWAGRDIDGGTNGGDPPRDALGAPAGPGEPAGDASPEEEPYRVLGVDEDATWPEISSAYRLLVKRHHPDLVPEGDDAERERSESKIRDLNVAYTELRLRRGR